LFEGDLCDDELDGKVSLWLLASLWSSDDYVSFIDLFLAFFVVVGKCAFGR
jgi:hypothetical protein